MKKDIFEKTKEELKEIIKDYPVDFVIIFGSLIRGNFRDDSDIDIAIHLNKDLDFLEIGDIVSRLETKLERDIDIVILNKLYYEDPILAFEIISKGLPVYVIDREKFIDFKYKTFIEYMDTEYLRKILDRDLKERIKNRRFGIMECLKKK